MTEIHKNRLDKTRENAEGIVRRLEMGTIIFKGNEVPLTEAQIERRKNKLDEQNLKLLFFGLPIIRIKQSGQVKE